MKKPFFVVFAAVLALLSGCIAYQMDKTPPCDGLSDAARAECKFKPKCRLVLRQIEARSEYKLFGNMDMMSLSGALKGDMIAAMQDSGLFSHCSTADGASTDDAVKVTVECTYTNGEVTGLNAFLAVFSLGIYPAAHWNYNFNFKITVSNPVCDVHEYWFQETIQERGGLSMIFAMPFVSNASREDLFSAMNRKITNNLLVKMQKDGFFSAEGRDKAAAAKADVVEAAKKTVAARRKELEDLMKAGIIDEAEFAAEVKKLEGAGK